MPQAAAFLADNLWAAGQLIILCGTSPELYFTLPARRSYQIKIRQPEPGKQPVLEHLRFADTCQGRWLALMGNNSRLLVLPECHHPNLINRFRKLMMERLSQDGQGAWHHPVAPAET